MRSLLRGMGWIACACAALSVLPSGVLADVPAWLPGFPLRAGTIVVLRWSSIPGSSVYKAYKKTGAEEFRLIYTGPQTIYSDANVSPSETVTYKVTATVEGIETPPSTIATLKGLEPLKPPAFFGATYPVGAITVRRSTPPGTVFFNLFRSEEKTGPYSLLDSTHQDIYTDRNVKRGKTYFYMEGYSWIADGSRYQVIKADRARDKFEYIGRLRGTYERKKKEDEDLPAITRIHFNPVDGKLYVSLGVTAEIKVIDPKTNKVVKTFGGLGTENGRFQGIGGLAFRRNGNILVLDHLMQVIKEFNRNYDYVATYADIEEKDNVRLSSNLLTTFAFREDIKRFYISSALGNRIYKFDIAD